MKIPLKKFFLDFFHTNPDLYFLVKKYEWRKKADLVRLLPTKSTDLIIGGFPRSANTFFTSAFVYATQSKYKISHHIHVPQQVMYGIRKGIPTFLCIRSPQEASISYSIFTGKPVELCLAEYIDFHQPLLKYIDLNLPSYRIIDFSDITKNLTRVFQLIRLDYSSCLDLIDVNHPDFTKKASDFHDLQNLKYSEIIHGSNDLWRYQSSPSEKRQELKKKLESLFKKSDVSLRNKSTELYQKFRNCQLSYSSSNYPFSSSDISDSKY